MNTTRLELLFPIPVLITKVEKHQEYRKTILPKIISEFKDDPNRSLSWGSLCHTWQSTAQRIWDEQFEKTVKDYFLDQFNPCQKNRCRISDVSHRGVPERETSQYKKGDVRRM